MKLLVVFGSLVLLGFATAEILSICDPAKLVSDVCIEAHTEGLCSRMCGVGTYTQVYQCGGEPFKRELGTVEHRCLRRCCCYKCPANGGSGIPPKFLCEDYLVPGNLHGPICGSAGGK